MHLSHKNGRSILNAGDKVTENDVNNFDSLVKEGKIKLDESDVELKKAKAKVKKEVAEADDAKKELANIQKKVKK